MKLLQTVCMHGTDRDYLPERFWNSLCALCYLKQGKMTPVEFKETMMSHMQVLCEVSGHKDIFGLFPSLQNFIIEKSNDLTYTAATLETQTDETKKDLHNRVTECLIGCVMTLRHNQEKSNMYKEIHKSCMIGHGNAFAMSGSEAVDQLIGFEKVGTKSPRTEKPNSTAVVLLAINEEPVVATETTQVAESASGSAGYTCWNCHKPGHSQYHCPDLTEEQQQVLVVKNRKKKADAAAKNKKNNIDRAVHFALGEHTVDDPPTDDPEEEEDQPEENCVDRFIFCQIAEVITTDNKDDDSFVNINAGEEASITETVTAPKQDQLQHEREELLRVLRNVAKSQCKTNPIGWADAVAYKLSLIGITNNILLFVSLPNLNTRLRRQGLSTLHNITLGGLSAEVRRTMDGDRTVVPDFHLGHA